MLLFFGSWALAIVIEVGAPVVIAFGLRVAGKCR